MNSRSKHPTEAEVIEEICRSKKVWHAFQRQLPLREKVVILLELQKQDLPLLEKHRQLEWWERPWQIEP